MFSSVLRSLILWNGQDHVVVEGYSELHVYEECEVEHINCLSWKTEANNMICETDHSEIL